MSQVVIQSGNAMDPSVPPLDLSIYIERVESDGGTIVNVDDLRAAFIFCAVNGINEERGFSITCPFWGVKRIGSVPVKMYSLFGEGGDIVFTGNNATYDIVTAPFPTISLPGSSLIKLDSLGRISTLTIGFAQAWKPLAGSAYTNANTLIQASGVDNVQLLHLFMGSGGGTGKYSGNGYGTSGSIVSSIVRKDWGAIALSINNAEMALFFEGSKVAVDNTLTVPTQGSYQVHLARQIFTDGAGRNPLQGNIAETWVINNPTDQMMIAITNRIKSIYP